MQNYHLFTAVPMDQKGYLTLEKPLRVFLETACVLGDPHGALTLERFQTVFFNWLYGYMDPILEVKKAFPMETFSRIKFSHLMTRTLQSTELQAALLEDGQNPIRYKGFPVIGMKPYMKGSGVTHIPCIYGVVPRNKSLDLPPDYQKFVREHYPPANPGVTRVWHYDKETDELDPFTRVDWDISMGVLVDDPKLAEDIQRDERLSKNVRTRTAKKNIEQWMKELFERDPKLFYKLQEEKNV